MVTGSYKLDIRCENTGVGCKTAPATFDAINERNAREQARQAGWKFHGNDVSCPECVRREMHRRQWRS
jgi:hypothetical protein